MYFDPSLSRTALCVGFQLNDWLSTERGVAWVTIERLATDSGRRPRTVRDGSHELHIAGHFHPPRLMGRGSANEWTPILTPKFEEVRKVIWATVCRKNGGGTSATIESEDDDLASDEDRDERRRSVRPKAAVGLPNGGGRSARQASDVDHPCSGAREATAAPPIIQGACTEADVARESPETPGASTPADATAGRQEAEVSGVAVRPDQPVARQDEVSRLGAGVRIDLGRGNGPVVRADLGRGNGQVVCADDGRGSRAARPDAKLDPYLAARFTLGRIGYTPDQIAAIEGQGDGASKTENLKRAWAARSAGATIANTES